MASFDRSLVPCWSIGPIKWTFGGQLIKILIALLLISMAGSQSMEEAGFLPIPSGPGDFTQVQPLSKSLFKVFRDVAQWQPTPPTRLDDDFDISCEPTPLDPRLFPDALPSSIYKGDLTFLCSLNGAMQPRNGQLPTSLNLGCACRNPGLHSFVFCHPPPLAASEFGRSHDLRALCQAKCRCKKQQISIGDAGGRKDIPIWVAGHTWIFLGEKDGTLSRYSATENGKTGWTFVELSEDGKWSRLADWNPNDSKLQLSARAPVVGELIPRSGAVKYLGWTKKSEQCPRDCSREWRCTQGCACVSKQVGEQRFRALGCQALTALALGLNARYGSARLHNKRAGEDKLGEWACPCNATYVSKGCCGTEDGFVWENPDARLGSLQVA